MRTFVLTALLGIFALAASAADVTGKWMASVPGRNGNQDVTFNLKQTGGDITGTVGTARGDQQISEGKATGDDISFVVSFDAGGNTIKQEYKGKVSGSEIKFTRSGGRNEAATFASETKKA